MDVPQLELLPKPRFFRTIIHPRNFPHDLHRSTHHLHLKVIYPVRTSVLTLLNNWFREASMKRRLFFGLVVGAAATCVSSTLAQKRPLQVGWLAFGHDAQGHIDRTLKEALAQSGFVEGRNIEITYRFAKGSSTQLLP